MPVQTLVNGFRRMRQPLTAGLTCVILDGKFPANARPLARVDTSMRRRFPLACVFLVFGVTWGGAFQAETQVKSGPQAGQELPGPFHPLNVTGLHAGNPHCLVCEYGADPVVAIFVRDLPAAEGSLAKLLQRLDKAVEERQAGHLRSFVVFLSDDLAQEESRKSLVLKIEGLTKDPLALKAVALAADRADGPENYKLNKEADVTVVVYHHLQVVANFAYAKDKMIEKDVDAIMAEVDKMVPPKKAKKKK
jgi:hypothetical protein